MQDIKIMTAAELFPDDDSSNWDWLKHVKGYATDNGFRITVFSKDSGATEYEYMFTEIAFDTQSTKWISNKKCPDIESAARKCLRIPSVVKRLIQSYEMKRDTPLYKALEKARIARSERAGHDGLL